MCWWRMGFLGEFSRTRRTPRIGVFLIVVLLLLPSIVSAVTYTPTSLRSGAIDDPANGITVISTQGFGAGNKTNELYKRRNVRYSVEPEIIHFNDSNPRTLNLSSRNKSSFNAKTIGLSSNVHVVRLPVDDPPRPTVHRQVVSRGKDANSSSLLHFMSIGNHHF